MFERRGNKYTGKANRPVIMGKAVGKSFLMRAITDEDWRIRRGAATALGNLKEPWAIKLLIVSLQDSISNVRKVSAVALDKMKWNPKSIQ